MMIAAISSHLAIGALLCKDESSIHFFFDSPLLHLIK